MNLFLKCEKTSFVDQIIKVANRHLTKRNCPEILLTENNPVWSWELDKSYDDEEFSISDMPNGLIRVSGGSDRALLFAVGKILHTGNFSEQNFSFGTWRGRTSPAKPERIIYLASHFHNYYHVAPLEELTEYLEDLALWGYNRLILWVDKHHYSNSNDPALLDFVDRARKIYLAGEKIGLRAIIGGLTNEGYNSTPEHLKATFPGRSFYYCEVCPSTPEGLALIRRNHQDTIDWFKDMNVGGIFLGSYDQGGCACEKCRPWGCNGMLKTGKMLSELYHNHFPACKIIYFTWLFDYCGENEWVGLSEKMDNGDGDWIDYIMADSHNNFPAFPLEHGVPGNRKLLNFPEISMWNMSPWGGFGANPLPMRFSKLWGQISHLSAGGMPYSEGIYEDFNKVIYSSFYWNGDNNIKDIVWEYANFEFGLTDSTDFNRLLEILEKNHWGNYNYADIVNKYPEYAAIGLQQLPNRPGLMGLKKYETDPEEGVKIVEKLTLELPSWGQQAWRWRIIYLRAFLDWRVKLNNFDFDAEADKALEELSNIYHADNIAEYKVSPPTRESVKRRRDSAVVF
jgi:hypothetical protein